MQNSRTALAAGTLCLALITTSCTSAPTQESVQRDPSSSKLLGLTYYDIDWTMDQIAGFGKSIHAVGQVTSIRKAFRDMGKGF